MTTLFDKIGENDGNAVVFPIREYWLDIGRMDDFMKANGDYTKVFFTEREENEYE